MNQDFKIKNNKRNVRLSTFKRKDIALLGVNNQKRAFHYNPETGRCIPLSSFPSKMDGGLKIYFAYSPPCSGAYKNAMLVLLYSCEDMDEYNPYSDYYMGHYLDNDIVGVHIRGINKSASDKRKYIIHILYLDIIQIDKRILEMKVECKALVNVIKPNIDGLGSYYPSLNEMNKSIVHLYLNNTDNVSNMVVGRCLNNCIVLNQNDVCNSLLNTKR